VLCLVAAGCSGGSGRHASVSSTTSTPSAGAHPQPGVGAQEAATAIELENAKPGSGGWQIPSTPPQGAQAIEGYADHDSAAVGDVVRVFVNTAAPSWHLEAWRMGWYGGTKGRLVWSSRVQPGSVQPAPFRDPVTHMAEARWSSPLAISIDSTWTPGAYLLVLVSSSGGRQFVPLTVRDDASKAALLLVDATTTWQAYNEWGGCSLYACPGVKGAHRATIVSFDRPYAANYGRGSADFLDHELPLIALVERLGLDVTYVTDVDLDRDPQLALAHRAVLSLGHDEYYSTAMRSALEEARDAGVNLAFLGANAIYRHIRLEPSWDGRARRREVNYRSTKDPGALHDPSAATVQWRNPPLNDPENALIGIQYGCAPMSGGLRIVDPSAWLLDGTGVSAGTTFPGLVGNEFDSLTKNGKTPANLQLIADSPVRCLGKAYFADMSWYAAPSGAGVFASGTVHWICTLDGTCPAPPDEVAFVVRVTENLLAAVQAGPAGAAHPSHTNVSGVVANR
jgi:hypothetical protein